jgi:YVTN family beta-propeller protein
MLPVAAESEFHGVMRTRYLLFVLALLTTACGLGEASMAATTPPPQLAPLEPVPTSSARSAPTPVAVATTVAPPTTTLPPTSLLELVPVATIDGDIAPKSIVSTGHGLFFAQNMMYRHTVTVYNAEHELVATIPDTVDLAAFGFAAHQGSYQGAPVEAAPTSDGAYVYVSNYEMYGEGFDQPGGDECNLAGWDESYLYRINTATFDIDQVISVGAVPKFVAVTPDDGQVLASNWCSFDLSVVDTATAHEIARVGLGRHPRGIAVTADAQTAYVAVMGSRDIAVVDLTDLEISWIRGVGANPRHLVLDSTGATLYATLNGEGTVAVIDTATGTVTAKIRSGEAPRSMAISDDDQSLYVVNYASDTVSKIDTGSLEVAQTIDVPHHPIGITFDHTSREVWVASYSGVITVFAERALDG